MPLRKRLFDLVVGLFLTVVTLPLITVILAVSAVVFRANPLFRQPRCGVGGDLFTFVKVRTLSPTAPVAADKYELEFVEMKAWGKLLRKYHLDELPQFWLVMAGKMSLVGPRPEMPELAAQFDQEFVTERQSVVPGCTGLWQISESAERLIGEGPEYDLHYVRRWTARLDFWICWYTAMEILGAVPAIKDVGQVPVWTGASLEEPAVLRL